MKKTAKRSLFAAILAACLLVAGMTALVGCSGGSGEGDNAGGGEAATTDTGEKTKAVIGYWGGTCEAPIFVAAANGYFEEAGIDAELVLLDSGGSNNSDAMVANGELDCYELTPDKFKPMEQGLGIKIIDSLHMGCIQGAASKESGIQTIEDLEGKTVATSAEGSIAQIMISSEMVQAGKDPSKVNWVVQKNPLMEQAIDSGEIDAFAAFDPFADIAVANGKTRFFSWHYDAETQPYLCCFVGCNTQSIEAKPELPGKLSAAFKQACDFIQNNPEEAAQIIIDGGYVEVDGDNGFTKDMMITEVSDYRWEAGNKQVVDDSFKYIWECVWRAGALEDSKIDTEEKLATYIDETLYPNLVQYSGAN